VERVCASFQSGLKLLAIGCHYVYTSVENAHCTVVWSRFAPNAEQTFYFLVAFFKISDIVGQRCETAKTQINWKKRFDNLFIN